MLSLSAIPNFFSRFIPSTNPFSSEKVKNLFQKIQTVAKAAFTLLVTVALYWINPTLVAMGFIAGIIFDDHILEATRKISNIWKTQPWSLCLIGGVASFLSLPVTLATTSFLWAASLGAQMSQEARRTLARQES